MTQSIAQALETLNQSVIDCRLCPRLVEHRERMALEKRARYRDQEYWGRPLPSFGDPEARVLIIGLAPAAHGGNRTGRMFTGDSSGNWLFETLYKFGFATSPSSQRRDDGLALTDAYVTAAVRCAPPANKPSTEEKTACRPYLLGELSLLTGVRIVVALGKIALRQLPFGTTGITLRDAETRTPLLTRRGTPTAGRRNPCVVLPPQPAEHQHRQAHPRDVRGRLCES